MPKLIDFIKEIINNLFKLYLLYIISDKCHFMMYMDSRLGLSYDTIEKTTAVAVVSIFGWFLRTAIAVLLHMNSKMSPGITKQKYCYSSTFS